MTLMIYYIHEIYSSCISLTIHIYISLCHLAFSCLRLLSLSYLSLVPLLLSFLFLSLFYLPSPLISFFPSDIYLSPLLLTSLFRSVFFVPSLPLPLDFSTFCLVSLLFPFFLSCLFSFLFTFLFSFSLFQTFTSSFPLYLSVSFTLTCSSTSSTSSLHFLFSFCLPLSLLLSLRLSLSHFSPPLFASLSPFPPFSPVSFPPRFPSFLLRFFSVAFSFPHIFFHFLPVPLCPLVPSALSLFLIPSSLVPFLSSVPFFLPLSPFVSSFFPLSFPLFSLFFPFLRPKEQLRPRL